MTRKEILEARDVTVYKRLLRVLGDYVEDNAGTEYAELLNRACDKGKQIMPKDKRALAILDCVLKGDTVPRIIQNLFNLRFTNLPIDVKPMFKNRRVVVASWTRGMYTSDRVKDLIDFEGKGQGKWTDIDKKKVTLLDMTTDEKEGK